MTGLQARIVESAQASGATVRTICKSWKVNSKILSGWPEDHSSENVTMKAAGRLPFLALGCSMASSWAAATAKLATTYRPFALEFGSIDSQTSYD